MPTDRERYDGYVKKINEMLSSDEYYAIFQKKLRAAKPILKLNKKHRTKTFDLDWVDMIESTLPHLDNIVRNPRKFIVIEEDIVDISLARAISTESVKHLAQHTNLISSVDKDGMVTPNKILNTTKEESFEIYENRFIYTLLKNLSQFVTRRLEAIKAAYVNDNVLELNVDTSVFTGKTRVFYNLDLIASLPIKEVENMEKEDMTVVERIAKMQRIINEFLGSPFAKQMVNSAPVRPPITRTNVILKNPDFKKALVLWQFVESYTKTGFAVDNEVKKVDIPDDIRTGVLDAVCLNSMLMEGLVDGQVEDSAFYNESNLNERDIVEEEKKEEEKPKEEEEKKEEEPKEEEQKEEEKPEPEVEEKEVEKEVEKEIESEIPEATDAIDEQTPQDEEGQPPENEEEKKPEEEDEEEEDEEADQYQELLSETKNVFQRSTDEATMSRAELQRINKAIDRVLLKFRVTNAAEASSAMYEQVQDEEADRAKLVRQIEKEMEVVRRAIDKRIAIAERERLANERALERERKRLADLEEKLKEQKALAAEEDSQEDEEDEVIEDDVIGDLVDDIEREDIEEEKRETKVEEFEELLEGQDKEKLAELGKALVAKHGSEEDAKEIEKALEESSQKQSLKGGDFFKPKNKGAKKKASDVLEEEKQEKVQEEREEVIEDALEESGKKETLDASDFIKGRRKPIKKASQEKKEIIEEEKEEEKDDGENKPPQAPTSKSTKVVGKTLKGSKVKGKKIAKLSDVK